MKTRRRPHFVIRWFKVGQIDPRCVVRENRNLLQNSGVYVIFSERRKIQYVGITYTQNFERRVGQHLQSLARLGGTLPEESYLYIGVVEPKAYKRLSRKMLEEIESLLVWVMKPAGNTAKRKPYGGFAGRGFYLSVTTSVTSLSLPSGRLISLSWLKTVGELR